MNKNIIILGLMIVLVFVFIDGAVAVEKTYSINRSEMPFNKDISLIISGEENTTISIMYDEYIIGPTIVTLNATGKRLINLQIDIPYEVEEENIISRVLLTNNNTYDFEFKIKDDIDFSMDVIEYCFVEDEVIINLNSPNNTTVNLLIESGEVNINKTFINNNAGFEYFTPTTSGNYEITVSFKFKDINELVKETFRVYEKLSCNIDSEDRIIENQTLTFESEIKGGIGTKTYSWDFDDNSHSTSKDASHRFGYEGDYEIRLIVTDSDGNSATCFKDIVVEETTYEVLIILINNETKKPLGDANVTFGDEIKKTNVNGKASFTEINKGRYDLEISRYNYESFSDEVAVKQDMTFNINLSVIPEDKKPIPFIKLLYPFDDAVIDSETSNFDFIVDSDSDITNCYFLINDKNSLGYKIEGTIDDIKINKDYSFEIDLTNGDFKWNVQCENQDGSNTSVDRYFSVSGLPEKVALQENTIEVDDKEDSEEITSTTIDNENLMKLDDAIELIESFKKEIISSGQEIRTVISLLEFQSNIDQSISEIKKIKSDMINLQSLKISPIDNNRKVSELMSNFENIKKSTPTKVLILNEKHYELNAEDRNITTAVDEYLKWKNINLSNSQKKKYMNNVKDAQKLINIRVDLHVVRITYMNNGEKVVSVVTKEVLSDEATGGVFLEIIPKEVAETIDSLTFSVPYEIVKKDPIVHIYTEQNNKFTYYVNKNVNIDRLMEIDSFILLDINHPNNKITGFAIFDSTTIPGKFFFIIILLGIVISGNYFIFFKDKTTRDKIITNFKDSTNSMKFTSNEEKLTGILNSVIDQLNVGDTNQALNKYSKVLDLYYKVDNKLQTDLKPIMTHLYYELEIFNVNNTINSAYKKSITGKWYEVVSELNEIEDTLSFIPGNFKGKINNKLEKLKLSMDIHMMKSHIIKDNDESVEDSLYSRKI